MGVPLLSEAESFPGGSKLRELPIWGLIMRTFHVFNKMFFCFLFSFLMFPPATRAQSQVLGEVQFVGKTKADKTSGVWVDGQYLGYVAELKEDKKVLLLPGEHEIAVRQSGYTDFTQKVVVEPHKKVVVEVVMLKDTHEHNLGNPAARMASQGGSVDWFRFWLQNYEDPDPAKAEQYARWRELRQLQEENDHKLPTPQAASK